MDLFQNFTTNIQQKWSRLNMTTIEYFKMAEDLSLQICTVTQNEFYRQRTSFLKSIIQTLWKQKSLSKLFDMDQLISILARKLSKLLSESICHRILFKPCTINEILNKKFLLWSKERWSNFKTNFTNRIFRRCK